MANPAPVPAPGTRPDNGSLQLRPGQLAAIFGVFLSGFAIWILPLVLGPLAMIFGGVAIYRGEERGRWVIGIAALCIVLGLIIHALPAERVGG
jgi:hypothetical protein